MNEKTPHQMTESFDEVYTFCVIGRNDYLAV